MTLLQIIILALIQGLTEFLPVSSSAHLVAAPELLGWERDQGPIFDLMAHFGTLFAVILVTVLFIVGLISVISAYAKSIKEASLLIMPVYFVSIAIGMTTMMSGEPATSTILYALPIYSSVHMIIAVLTFEIATASFLVMIFSNSLKIVCNAFSSKGFTNAKSK